ncbi:MAG: hypothetical protein XD73_0440 [Anaerolinea thermophila]|uniref:LysM domain-containing protein n=1 Tax=Anaerolinea thermophila TaxID=167964 RepID=A0A101FYL0_9CHLR|nr:MAG: hypothetical protein XD73_0440 [Anaerolinea thermophila]
MTIALGLLIFPAGMVLSSSGASAQDLINLINGWRVAEGYSALTIDPILMTSAYDTALTMAMQGLHTHIGNVSGRVEAYGYGDGSQVWCTENFAMSYGEADINEIYGYWDDPDHRLPATMSYYKHVGAGVASYDGWYYYILHACYTSGGIYNPVPGTTTTPYDGTPYPTATNPVSQIVVPVITSTPQPDGSVVHIVQNGQSLWSIAIEYGTKIDIIKELNGLTTNNIYNEQELLIYPAGSMPTPAPSATPSPTAAPTQSSTPTEEEKLTITPTTEVTPTQVVPAGGKNNIPPQTIIGYAIVLVSVIGLLAMLVDMSVKKVKK